MGIYRTNDTGYTVSVRDFGAIGDGVTDDTDAIQDAIDAASSGATCGIVFFPHGYWKFSVLTITAGVTLKGIGWKTVVNAAKGDSQWTTLSNHGGTVLYSTSTSGSAITIVGTSVFPAHVQDLMLVCSGSTVTGIELGSNTYPKVQCQWRNILVSNCNLGVDMEDVEDSSFYDLRFRGNSSGLEVGQNCAQNVFTNTEVQVATVKGIYLHDAGNNVFHGILIQACTDGDGIHVANAGSTNNCFEDIWCENNNSGFDWAINVQGGEKSIFKRVRLGTQYDGINVAATNPVNTIFEAVRNLGNATWNNAGNSTCFIKSGGGDPGHFTDTGQDTFYIQDPNISNSNKLKCPELEVTGDVDISGELNVDTVNGQVINSPGSPLIEKIQLTSSIADQSVMIEYTNTADSKTALIGLGPNNSGNIRVVPAYPSAAVNVIGGMTVGSTESGAPGDGYINVTGGLQLSGSLYDNPDYVLMDYYQSQHPNHLECIRKAEYLGLRPLDEVEQYMSQHYCLPRIKEVAKGGEVFARTDAALEKIEELFLYVIQMEKRLKILEKLPRS